MRIAIFASGNGTNFEALAKACITGEVGATVALMVCDKPGAGVISRAEGLGVKCLVLSPKSFESKAHYEQAILEALQAEGVELICLAGYMRILTDVILRPYDNRILNVHPSLLPSFKGAHAMEQALEAGVKIFGVTIHFVSAELDSGAIIDQDSFRYEGTTLEQLEQIVHAVEHPLYIRALKSVISQIKK